MNEIFIEIESGYDTPPLSLVDAVGFDIAAELQEAVNDLADRLAAVDDEPETNEERL